MLSRQDSFTVNTGCLQLISMQCGSDLSGCKNCMKLDVLSVFYILSNLRQLVMKQKNGKEKCSVIKCITIRNSVM